MVFCCNCGTKNESGSKFCCNCGSPIVEEAPSDNRINQSVGTKEAVRVVQIAPDASSPCGLCGKGISATTIAVTALGKKWHKECFKCKKCGNKLFSFSKFYEEDNLPVCSNCFKKTLPYCAGCHKQITTQYTKYGGRNWHNECMKCAGCGKVFNGESFFEDGGKLWHLNCAK